MIKVKVTYDDLVQLYCDIAFSSLNAAQKTIVLGAIANMGNSFERSYERDESFFINKTIELIK